MFISLVLSLRVRNCGNSPFRIEGIFIDKRVKSRGDETYFVHFWLSCLDQQPTIVTTMADSHEKVDDYLLTLMDRN